MTFNMHCRCKVVKNVLYMRVILCAPTIMVPIRARKGNLLVGIPGLGRNHRAQSFWSVRHYLQGQMRSYVPKNCHKASRARYYEYDSYTKKEKAMGSF